MALYATTAGDLVWDTNVSETNSGLITDDGAQDASCCGCDGEEDVYPPEGSECYDCRGLCCYSGLCDGNIGWPDLEVWLDLENLLEDESECRCSGDFLSFHGFLTNDCLPGGELGINAGPQNKPSCHWGSNTGAEVFNFTKDDCEDRVGVRVSIIKQPEFGSNHGSPIWECRVGPHYSGIRREDGDIGMLGSLGSCCGTGGKKPMYIDSNSPCVPEINHDVQPLKSIPAGYFAVSLNDSVDNMDCCRAYSPSGNKKECVEDFGFGKKACSTCCDTDPLGEDGEKRNGLEANPGCKKTNK